jgi:4-hydroxy-tetrahydrodipicolinate synthase
MDECFRTFGDQVLISYPFDDAWSIFVCKYGQQWAGSGLYQIMQTPDDPREVRLFNLLRDGRMDEAMALYWQMNPVRICHMQEIQQTMGVVGMYHIQAWKYEASLLGMTGGVIREPRLRLPQQHKDVFRLIYRYIE